MRRSWCISTSSMRRSSRSSGVGTIGLVDFDVVDVTNLQRQVLHGTSDVGRPKLDSARERARGSQSERARRDARDARSRRERARASSASTTSIVDGTDNFATRYLVNDACVLLGKPNVYGSHLPFRGPGVRVRDDRRPVLSLPLPEPPPPGSCRAARRAACSACCPGSSARSRRPRRSS